MERHDRPAIVRLFWESLSEGEVRLDGPQAQHARVRRVQRGDGVQLVDGRGASASGRVLMAGNALLVAVERIDSVPRPTLLEIIVPVADRDHMLIAAEKSVELQVTGWRPAYFARSKSVSSRGDGEKFRAKLRARMQSALEQSGAAWMPDLHEEVAFEAAMSGVSGNWQRFLLDAEGSPMAPLVRNGPVALAVGPEGGVEREEVLAAERLGWRPVSIARSTLRFETAVIAGAAIVRGVQLSFRSA